MPVIPSKMRAVVVQQNHTISVEELPVPTLVENEILVKVEAVAQDPTDWKLVKFVENAPGNILGSDFSGVVVQVAKGCKSSITIGDHVAGFVQGGFFKDRGAYAQYLKADSDLVWVVPEGTVSHEQAATMGCTLWTAVQALFHPTRLGLVEPPSQVVSNTWLFIYGGSTSVGQFAIQLAHLAGYKVTTVASPRNHSLLKSLGAGLVYDYESPDFVSGIKRATNDEIHAALDAFTSNGSESHCINILGPGPGKVVVLNPVDETVKKMRSDVEVQFTIVYTALGCPFDFLGGNFPTFPEDRGHMAAFLSKLPKLVKDGAIKPNKVKLWEGGLENVWEGLTYMMEGKISAEKIVYRP